jgi:hypothetical protein
MTKSKDNGSWIEETCKEGTDRPRQSHPMLLTLGTTPRERRKNDVGHSMGQLTMKQRPRLTGEAAHFGGRVANGLSRLPVRNALLAGYQTRRAGLR